RERYDHHQRRRGRRPVVHAGILRQRRAVLLERGLQLLLLRRADDDLRLNRRARRDAQRAGQRLRAASHRTRWGGRRTGGSAAWGFLGSERSPSWSILAVMHLRATPRTRAALLGAAVLAAAAASAAPAAATESPAEAARGHFERGTRLGQTRAYAD